jgi:hypothetical protein
MDTKAIAEKYGIPHEVVKDLLTKLRRTNGRQVQFSDESLGGMGQWSGGMVMIGRMGDDALKAKIGALCAELAQLAQSSGMEKTMDTFQEQSKDSTKDAPSASAAGSQNGVRYAYFAEESRLEIERDGVKKTYDATGYRISGVAQDQSTGVAATLRFTTADGDTIDLDRLKPVS